MGQMSMGFERWTHPGSPCRSFSRSPSGSAPKVRPRSSQARRHDAPGSRDGDDADPGAFHFPQDGQGVDGVAHLAACDAQGAGPLEGGVVDVVLAHEGARVGQGGLRPRCAPSRLENNDRLEAACTARRFKESKAALQALHVDDDAPCLRIVGEVVEGLRDVEVAGVAHVDGLTDVAPGEVARRDLDEPRLGDQGHGQEALGEGDVDESRVEPAVVVDHPQRVGAEDADARFAGAVRDLFLEHAAVLVGVGEALADDDHAPDAGPDAVLEGRRNPVASDGDDGQIDDFGDVGDGWEDLQAQDFPACRVHGEDAAPEAVT